MNAARVAATTLLVSLIAAAAAGDEPSQRRRTPVVEVFEKARDAVVNISTTRIVRVRSLRFPSMFDEIFDFGMPRMQNRRIQSIGSGVIVHESGHLVTNAHVVSQASDVHVTFADQRTLAAEIIAVDPEHDLAVLKVDADGPLPYVRLGRSDDLMVGETVVAIGNPLGLQHTVTAGIVSALNRELHFSRDTTYRGLIQTDASINPGNSGGPLLNVNADLIGINTAIRGDAQNIGFAIPVDELWHLLPEMLDIERRQRVRFGLKVYGPQAEVVAVRPDSPAARAELKPGDRVLQFDGQPLRDSIDYYVHLLTHQPGDKIALEVKRGERTLRVTVPLQTIPPPDGRELARRLMGLTLMEIPASFRREYDLPSYVGLVVEEVEGRGPADRARILPTDVILRLDGVTVRSLQDVGLALERVTPGDDVAVEGLRLRANPPFVWDPVLIRTRQP
ncbi:MAG: trypsin-like peptidase domain-containing protein [Planctomycetes bacterium]|nr:trypsin-like peptidase domain-containing protein [Planctomycetota bacterium]